MTHARWIMAFTMQGMIGYVTHEEQGGKEERGQHGIAVRGDFAPQNEHDSEQQRRGAEAIEQGIERREKGQSMGEYRRGLAAVDQPKQKHHGCRTDRANGKHRTLDALRLVNSRVRTHACEYRGSTTKLETLFQPHHWATLPRMLISYDSAQRPFPPRAAIF